jgi:HEAT repeat protein
MNPIEDLDLRLEAMEGLGWLESPRLFRSCVDLLKDPSYEIRLKAVRILGHFADPRLVPVLTEVLLDSGSNPEIHDDYSWDFQWDVQVEVIRTLGAIPSPGSAEPILRFYEREKAPDLYEAVFSSLCRIGTPEAVGFLKDRLLNGDPIERREVLAAMANHPVMELRDQIIDTLNGRDPAVRINGIRALCRIDPTRMVPLLCEMGKDREESVRKEAVRLLSEMNLRPWEETVASLLKDPSAEVRVAAISAMPENSVGKYRNVLLEIMKEDPDEEAAFQAIFKLSSMHDPETADEIIYLIRNEEVSTFFRVRCTHLLQEHFPDRMVELVSSLMTIRPRQVAVAVASRLVGCGGQEVCLHLLSYLNSYDSVKRLPSERSPGSGGETTNETILHSDEPEIRRADEKERVKFPGETPASLRAEDIVQILSEAPCPEVIAALEICLKSDDALLVSAAAFSLGKLNAKESGLKLESILNSPSGLVRSKVITALGELGYTPCIPLLEELLASDPEGLVREKAAEALGMMKSKETAKSLIQGLKDADFAVRKAVVVALGKTGHPEAVSPLLDTLFDSERYSQLKEEVASSLRELNKDATTTRLLEMLRSPDRAEDHPVVLRTLTNLYSG